MYKKRADVVVIGGGIIGISVAYGLVKQNTKVILLDKEDLRFTASRGNFGLVWVQGKGSGMPRYAEWSLEASKKWPEFAKNLEKETNVDLNYQKTGGLEICLCEKQFLEKENFVKNMRNESKSKQYDCEMMSRIELQKILPKIKLGKDVTGASFCPHDGFVNPLNLLKALYLSYQKQGGIFNPGQLVKEINYDFSEFRIFTNSDCFSCEKLVIASGLSTSKIAAEVGINVPLSPERGQILVTESIERILPFATNKIRQNFDGSFMLGDSNENVGFNLETTNEMVGKIASEAIRVFPILKTLQLVRSWASLRILTPDKNPIYVESEEFPGAYVATSHSGVSLASLNSSFIVDWILNGIKPLDFEIFHPRRFNV